MSDFVLFRIAETGPCAAVQTSNLMAVGSELKVAQACTYFVENKRCHILTALEPFQECGFSVLQTRVFQKVLESAIGSAKTISECFVGSCEAELLCQEHQPNQKGCDA